MQTIHTYNANNQCVDNFDVDNKLTIKYRADTIVEPKQYLNGG